ncbi:MAG: transcription initiation factor IIB family protein [Zestosphaera sp.]
MIITSCASSSIIYDEIRGEYICTETGEVLEERVVDTGPEWRGFEVSNGAGKVRGSEPVTSKVHDYGLTTSIDELTLEGRKLNDLNKSIRASSREKKIVKALQLANTVINKLNLPNSNLIKNDAGMIVNRLYRRGLIKRKNMKAMIAAVLITTLKNYSIPFDSREILNLCQVTQRDVWKALLKIHRDSGERIRVGVVDPLSYVRQYSNILEVSPETESLAMNLVTAARRLGITSGKGPQGVAAASLYLASILMNQKLTQQDISEKLNVTEVTLRNRYRDLVNELSIVVEL